MHRRLFRITLALTLAGGLSWLPLRAHDRPNQVPALTTGGVRTVVIDPGHGGDDAGAVSSAGAPEKDITLAVARRFRTALDGRPDVIAVLTRDEDRRLSLRDRTALANSRKASALISLHLNTSASDAPHGAEFTVLAADASGGVAIEPPGTPVPVAGGSTRVIEFAPWDRVALRHRDESLRLARALAATFESVGQLSPRGVQSAPLAVLTGATMPAVVAELGYLTNPEDMARLGSTAGQEAIAQQLREAVLQFLSEIPAP
jgi:N-acetylmuramoyl-L-alanine amidase